LREIITADAVLREVERRGRQGRHVHVVDDFDALRKIPKNIPSQYEKYLGQPLADIPAPKGSGSYGDFFLKDLRDSAKALGIKMEFLSGRQKYREGFFVAAIEKALEQADDLRKILEEVSGRQLEDTWSPIQIMEDEYLKKRHFLKLDKTAQTLHYEDKAGLEQSIRYDQGQVKLDWRIDWPARWWLLKVGLEPSGRDHSTKGSSIDTGEAIMHQVFKAKPPIAVAYDFVNRTGDTKKMSASAGTGITAAEVMRILPPEIIRFFMLRYAPQKRLYFDPMHISQLIDEFAQLQSKQNKTEAEAQLMELSTGGLDSVISNIPFSHLMASYQASLKDPDKTLEIIKRTEHGQVVQKQRPIIKKELIFIDQWLAKWAPDEVKFELRKGISQSEFSDQEKSFLAKLAEKIAGAPKDAGGEWFHKTLYDLKDEVGMEPKAMFETLYSALIGEKSGPRAGWFLQGLPRDWLIKRLKLKA